MERYAQLAARLAKACPGLILKQEEPLSRHTSFRIGGPAPLMAFPDREDAAATCLRLAREAGVRVEVLGNGTNLLAADGGVDAFFLHTGKLCELALLPGGMITAGCGCLLSRLATAAAGWELSGLEFAHGIPGSVGGAVVMNAGAYGGEMAGVVRRVRYLAPGSVVTEAEAEGEALDFAYRRSRFSGGGELILSVTLALVPGKREEIEAGMRDLAARRKASQPLEYPSAGSFFKRPPGQYAAALIDQCGLRGLTVGGAQVSEKHAGFLVNRGEATCADMLELAERTRSRVREQTGVELEPEVRILR